MKHIITFFTLSLLTIYPGLAQHTQLTLNDVVNGGKNYTSFLPQKLEKLQWADDKHYSYVKDDMGLVLQDVTGKESTVLSLDGFKKIAPEYKSNHFPSYQWHDNGIIEFKTPQKRLFYDTSNQSIQQISFPKEAQNIDLSYTSKQLAYTIDNNLYYATEDFEKKTITNALDTGIVCGQTVHRVEFGIYKGTFWSPDGQLLAFYRKDESMVEDYPLVDINAREAKVHNIKYPMAGMTSHEVTVGIYNTNTNKTIYLKTGLPADHYLTNIAWSPDNQSVYIAEINRGQDTMHFNSYDALTGNFIKTLFTETDKQYVEPQNVMVFLPNDPTRFIWQSRRDGYNHLYLYSTDGTLIKQLTKGDWEVTDILGFDSKGKYIFISSTKKSYLERHTYRVALYKNEMRCLTQDRGYHKSLLSHNGQYIIDTWSDIEIPAVTDLIEVKNLRKKNIFTADNPYALYDIGKTKLFTLKSADSITDLSCRMVFPPDFDSTKQYPVVIYVYGGPHSQMITQSWKGRVNKWQLYMAQKGYILFTMDNRGTSYRGEEFEQVIHRHLGKNEMKDQMKGYEYLTSLSYIDTNRIGIFGWSYGGYMTTSLMTHYPDAFKVGVAGGPVIDWSNYEVMYGERYMDTPQENPEGYAEMKVTNYAKNLKGRLLIIHGGQDPIVVWQHSQKFVDQCIKDGVQLDYFIYPNHEHNVRGFDRVHLMDKIIRYFDDFL